MKRTGIGNVDVGKEALAAIAASAVVYTDQGSTP